MILQQFMRACFPSLIMTCGWLSLTVVWRQLTKAGRVLEKRLFDTFCTVYMIMYLLSNE